MFMLPKSILKGYKQLEIKDVLQIAIMGLYCISRGGVTEVCQKTIILYFLTLPLYAYMEAFLMHTV